MKKVEYLQSKLKQGSVYRRKDLEQWSTAVDRHVKELLASGHLVKLSGGLYACPRKTAFGNVLPDDKVILKAFLKGDDFLVISPNSYNSLGLGTTQLYNRTIVYNRRRHQPLLQFGNRSFDFHKKRDFPKKLSPEFLLIDMVENLDTIAEDKEVILDNVLSLSDDKIDKKKVLHLAQKYASPTTKNFFLYNYSHNSHVL